MEPDFKAACEAIKPHFEVFANKFENDLKDGVFMGDVDAFVRAKSQNELLQKMRRIIDNLTCEETEK